MYIKETQLNGLTVTLTAHRDPTQQAIMVSVQADRDVNPPPARSARVALVIDRSGSMHGDKIQITTQAVARFIRSLNPTDQVSVVAYDDQVQVLCGLSHPSEQLASQVERLCAGGSTALYDGWLTGAKIVGKGGRVVLLSDGQANVGPFIDAISLGRHANRSFVRYGVTTTTIGIGEAYDEAVMAGMARNGGGGHYFAHDVSAIVEAFSQERFSIDAMALEAVSVRIGSVTEQFGHFWAGESKNRLLQVASLSAIRACIRFTDRATGEVRTHDLDLPTEFGYSEVVRLEMLLQQASEAEAGMHAVQDPRSAAQMRDRLRAVVLALMAHPSADDESVALVIGRLTDSINRLDALERSFDESEAMIHRKRSAQLSHNLREPAKAYSSFAEDRQFVSAQMRGNTRVIEDVVVDDAALKLASLDRWIEWAALPVSFGNGFLTVAREDPRDGFVLREIESEVGVRVQGIATLHTTEEIHKILQSRR